MRPTSDSRYGRQHSYNEDLKVVPSGSMETIVPIKVEPVLTNHSSLYGAMKMLKRPKTSAVAKKPAMKKIAPGRTKTIS